MESSLMAENGEDKLLAVARHIAKTLGRTDTMTDDILQIFSTFDGRFSREKMSEKIDENDPRSLAALELTLKSLDRQISQYVSADQPIWSNSVDSAAFLDTLDELIGTIKDWDPISGEKLIGSYLDRADDLLQQAMFRLEDEFRLLIERSTGGGGGESFELNRMSADEEEEYDGEEDSIPVANPISDYDILIDALPSGTIADLHQISKRMVGAGFGKECAHVYSSCRRDFLEESISRLGLKKLSSEEVQKMAWSDLEDEIEKWIKGMNVALRILFPSERRLCDRIFFGLSAAADLSLMEVCRGIAIQLLNFADGIAISSKSPERLFKVLDVFECLRDLMPEFDEVFSDQYCLFIRTEAAAIWKRIGESIRGIFMELENLIRRDPAKAAVPGGGLHPITRYVMNYLRAACGSRVTLEQVFQDNSDYRNPDNTDRSLNSTSLSVQMSWIMELLERNLEGKSKIYKESGLSYIFLINNGRYIVQKVKDSELASLLGDDWIRKHTTKVRQNHVNYQRSSWNKVIAALKLDNNSLAQNVAAKSIKEKLKVFNMYFDDICRAQSTWIVADEQLRTELRNSIAGNLSPAYRNFLGKFQTIPEIGKHAEKYIKYSVEDIEDRINQLFQGNGGSAGSRK
ncbi:Exocyst subunit exo70 family protein [Thalictrum thalictroides]|uniref:Exocyst subunit Exo70 family protein n=1 Tax=Thalictrum thalictroides TaxID=46969 RepID=A0A7J6XCH3_THATH|nr:Exocyst subunit exo70 family protein [Thalictrum thalictroides]